MRFYYQVDLIKLSEGKRKALVAKEFDISISTVWRFVNLVRGQDESNWLPLLLPQYKGCQVEAEMSPEAWGLIIEWYLNQSKPTASAVIERVRRVCEKHGLKMPSDRTIRRRIDKDIPHWRKVLGREGSEAFDRLFPPLERDYTSLEIHECWESDGHRADVFCKWPDETIARPIIVVWRDLRSRKVLGWKVGRVESADLIRLSFRDAAIRANAIPREALLDNGRGYAGKLMTGGQKNRYRFNIKEEDTLGILTMMECKVHWSTPGRGQVKPVESFWNVIVDRVSKHSDFSGAYCGNRPDAKPEEFDAKKAVPVEQYITRLDLEINRYNAASHRGQGMFGRSPNEITAELLPHAKVRTPTQTQLRLCLLAAQKVLLDKKDHSIRILGNRYWSESLAEISHRGPYDVRFDPEDARVPVSVYDGERFLCDAELRDPTGFLNQEAAKAHQKAKQRWKKAKKDQAKAEKELLDSKSWEDPEVPPLPPEKTAHKIAELVHPKLTNFASRTEPVDEDDPEWDEKLLKGLKRTKCSGEI